MDPANSNLTQPLSEVNPQLASILSLFPGSKLVSARVPSLLDYYGQNSAFKPYSRKQRRAHLTLNSFDRYTFKLGCKVSLVTLTTRKGEDWNREKLRKHHQELVRRAERVYKTKIITYTIETSEGGGVLHIKWAMIGGRGYIPHKWLSLQWGRIHGSWVVDIRSITHTKKDFKRVSRYMINQYLAGQCLFERSSYSWEKLGLAICKAWAKFKKLCNRYSIEWLYKGPDAEVILVPYREMIEAWGNLLDKGEVIIIGHKLMLENRTVVEVS